MAVKYAKQLPLEDYAEEAQALLRLATQEIAHRNCWCAGEKEPCVIHGRIARFLKVKIERP